MTSRFLGAISRAWLAEEVYGFRAAQSVAQCQMPFLYAKALLVAAGGRAGPVAGLLNAHFAGAVDTELMTFVSHFDAQDIGAAALENSARIAPANARVVVYDALTAATANGASTLQASKIAAELGVEPATAEQLADICDREASIEARRRKMLLGDEMSLIA
uniref:Uncharacterized protein n=1 Tax=Neobodo designis TaxID=312471 RepID=A0A7S1QGU3_NEODS|mmetsp:Transcript_43576/g.134567  ORF Transcript_43576/g.134567 Transcript_43576/m.134567 type:complete len:161 (+) Transcript_43576:577-1059(+)